MAAPLRSSPGPVPACRDEASCRLRQPPLGAGQRGRRGGGESLPVAPRVWLRRGAQGLARVGLTAPLSPSAHRPQAQRGAVSGWAVKGTVMYGPHAISATRLRQAALPPSSLSPLGWGSLFSPSCLPPDPTALPGGPGPGGPRYSKAPQMATGAQSCKLTTGYETAWHGPMSHGPLFTSTAAPSCLSWRLLPRPSLQTASHPPGAQAWSRVFGLDTTSPPLISQQFSSPLAPLTPDWPHDPLALSFKPG